MAFKQGNAYLTGTPLVYLLCFPVFLVMCSCSCLQLRHHCVLCSSCCPSIPFLFIYALNFPHKSSYFLLAFLHLSRHHVLSTLSQPMLELLVIYSLLCRRKILRHLGSDLEQELNFCREMIEMNPKNYQVW